MKKFIREKEYKANTKLIKFFHSHEHLSLWAQINFILLLLLLLFFNNEIDMRSFYNVTHFFSTKKFFFSLWEKKLTRLVCIMIMAGTINMTQFFFTLPSLHRGIQSILWTHFVFHYFCKWNFFIYLSVYSARENEDICWCKLSKLLIFLRNY